MQKQLNNPFNNAIDCILDINAAHIVLIRREKEPYKGFWALPGGRQLVNEELEDTVVREVEEETGVAIQLLSRALPYPVRVLGEDTFLDQIRTYHSGSDPRGGNSTVYAVQLHGDAAIIEKSLRNGDGTAGIGVFPLDSLPELAFDHCRFVEDYFVRLRRYKNPLPAVDAIVEYNGKFVFVERSGIPKGRALPGGFAKYGKTYEQSVIDEVKEETGLDFAIKGLVGVYSNPERDPRKHVTSTAFYGTGSGILRFGDDAKAGGLFSATDVPKLVFDHNRIFADFAKAYHGFSRRA